MTLFTFPALGTQGNRFQTIEALQAEVRRAIAAAFAEIGEDIRLVGEWAASSGAFPTSPTPIAGSTWIVTDTGTVDGVAFIAGDKLSALGAGGVTYAGNWLRIPRADLPEPLPQTSGGTGASSLGAATVTAAGGSTPRTLATHTGDTLSPLDFGAVGNGTTNDTTAFQAALTYFNNTKPARLRDARRVLDLGGRRYAIHSPLSLAGCDGLCIQNGTLLAAADFATDRALLEHNVPGTELWGFTAWNLTLQCNQRANGLLLMRTQENTLFQPVVLGWGQREYGIRLGPVAYSADLQLISPRISGFSVSYADNPIATKTGIGLDAQIADGEMIGGSVDTGLKCVVIHSSFGITGGAHIWNGVPGNEATAAPNNIGVEYINNHGSPSILVGNIFDNCCINMPGQQLYKIITGNKFFGNQEQLEAGIFFRATATGQVIADNVITNNSFHSFYKRPIIVDQTNGTYVALNRTLAADNVLRSFIADSGSFTESLMATRGNIQLQVTTGFFDASNTVSFNLGGRALLLPSYGDILQINVGILRNSDSDVAASTITYLGAHYNASTGRLRMKFSAPFNGRLMISFDQSYMSRFYDPEAV